MSEEKRSARIKKVVAGVCAAIGARLKGFFSKDNAAWQDIARAFSHINPRKAFLCLFLGVLLIYGLTGIYIVNSGEQAVIRRFGAVLPRTITEGIHYRLPFPIDRVQKANTAEIRRADVGVNLPDHMHTGDAPQPVQLLTGDENIITAEAIVHYTVKDAAAFLYSVNNNSEQVVRYSVEAALVHLMANMKVDEILSTAKVEAQNSVIREAQATLDRYNAGIQIAAFNIQMVIPPSSVAQAFRDVTAAQEDREKAINQARGYANSLIPEARGKAQAALSKAEAYRTEKINQAAGDAANFISVLTEYRNDSSAASRDTTKYRMLLESFEKILPQVKKYIVDSNSGNIDLRLLESGITAFGTR
jgi:membrane protease subunit HflK